MAKNLIMPEDIHKYPAWKLANGQITIDKTAYLLSRIDTGINRRIWKVINYSPGLEIDMRQYNYHGCFESKEQAMRVMAKLCETFEAEKFL